MSEFAQTDLPDRILASAVPLESAVMAGSSTLEMLGIRRAQDIDALVPEDVYRHLRELHNLEEQIDPRTGYRHLVGDGLDIGTNWEGKSAAQVQEGAYSHRGIRFAGLPDLYEAKQSRGLEKDARDLELIRQRLYGDRPLPKDMLGKDLSFVQGIIPEHLKDHPAVHVAANGLYIVRTIFGQEGESVRSYTGSVEQTPVPGTYHAWEHSAYGARDGQESMDKDDEVRQLEGRRRHSNNERLSALTFTNHDVFMGHGRRAANPEAHDEKQAAELVVRQLEGAGVTDEQLLGGSYQTTIVTTWDEKRKTQDIDPARGHLPEQQHGAAMDMSAMRRSDGPLSTVRLAVEDLFRVGAGYDKPLHRLVEQLNAELPEGATPIRVTATEDGLQLIEQYPDFPVVKQTPDGPQHMTLQEALGTHIGGSGWFYGNYQFPEKWRAGDPALQAQNAQTISAWGQAIKDGRIAPTQILGIAENYRDSILQNNAMPSGAMSSSRGQSDKEISKGNGADALLQALRNLRGTME